MRARSTHPIDSASSGVFDVFVASFLLIKCLCSAHGHTGSGSPLSGSSRKKLDTEPSGLAGAIPRGEAVKQQWVASAELVPAKVLAENWGLTPQALGPTARRGEVFALVIKRQRLYPRASFYLDRRRHGALGGTTLLEILTSPNDANMLSTIVQLAKAWADHETTGAESAEAT